MAIASITWALGTRYLALGARLSVLTCPMKLSQRINGDGRFSQIFVPLHIGKWRAVGEAFADTRSDDGHWLT